MKKMNILGNKLSLLKCFFSIVTDVECFCFSMLIIIINKTDMASIAKRKQQVNELRKAHFPFGFQSNKDAVSVYRQGFTQQPVQVVQPNGDRGSHFTIGSDEPTMAKNTYQTQFKDKFSQHVQPKREPVKKSNDENNIVLGFGNVSQGTNYKDQFTYKQQERSKPVDQRVISVDLGDTLTDFTTSYNKAFEGGQGQRVQKANNNISGTHLVLGYENNYQFVTSNAASHNIKPILPAPANTRSYGTNISLGSDENQFHSENKSQFAHKNSSKQTVEKEKVLDFKSAHFQFGFPEEITPNYSETQAHYNTKPLNAVRAQGQKGVSVELKHDSNNYFSSSYGEQYAEKKGERAELLNKNGRNSNVVIGMGPHTYQTEAKQQFLPKNIERVRGKGAEGSLVLGDGTRQFTTQYQQTHGNKYGQLEANRVGKDEITKMRAQNFVKGFNELDYKLHSQSYGAVGGQGNRLPRQLIDQMRSTNIVNSDDNAFHATTSNRAAFGWKKNDDF